MVSHFFVFFAIETSFLKELKQFLGEFDDDIDFEYEQNTKMSYSCAATFHDEMFVFGGSTTNRQVNMFKNYELQTVHIIISYSFYLI